MWLDDAVILRTAKYTCGIDYLCINHLDTLGKIGLKLGYIKFVQHIIIKVRLLIIILMILELQKNANTNLRNFKWWL